VFSVAFSSDEKQIVSSDGRIKLWEAVTGREIRTFTSDYGSLSVAFNPDGRYVISGSRDKTMKLWDVTTSREIKTFSGHQYDENSVIFTHDGRQILSGSSDGTIRLWDLSTGKEVAQFISFNDGEWIVVTSDGYFNASPNEDRYLNVRVGNNVYGIDQYRNTFYNPQIVEARLQGRPDPVHNLPPIQRAGEPPAVVIRNPVNGARLTTNQVELSVVIESKQPIKNIKFLVNGKLLSGDAVRGMHGVRGVELEATGVTITGNQNKLEFSVNLQLDPGTNRIEVIANNPLEGKASVEVFSQQAAAQNTRNLWILSIGVNIYNSSQLDNLRFAVNDAREIINVFKIQEGRIYNRVNNRLIADGAIEPTKENIMDGFDYLKGAGENDLIILFIAGHGMLDQNGSFFFMPKDAIINDNGSIRSANAVSLRDIQSIFEIPGQKIVFIDACHSAGVSNSMTRVVDNTRLQRSLQSEGTVVLVSSKGDQYSQERQDISHGVFTYAILQGLRGEAQQNNGTITMTALNLFVSNKVRELTNNQQEPVFGSSGYTDFPVARTK